MSLTEMLDQLNSAEDFDIMSGPDEVSYYSVPNDVTGEPVEEGESYWKVSDGLLSDRYVYDDEDSIVDFLDSEGFDAGDYDYGYHALREYFNAEKVWFDGRGNEHGGN